MEHGWGKWCSKVMTRVNRWNWKVMCKLRCWSLETIWWKRPNCVSCAICNHSWRKYVCPLKWTQDGAHVCPKTFPVPLECRQIRIRGRISFPPCSLPPPPPPILIPAPRKHCWRKPNMQADWNSRMGSKSAPALPPLLKWSAVSECKLFDLYQIFTTNKNF